MASARVAAERANRSGQTGRIVNPTGAVRRVKPATRTTGFRLCDRHREFHGVVLVENLVGGVIVDIGTIPCVVLKSPVNLQLLDRRLQHGPIARYPGVDARKRHHSLVICCGEGLVEHFDCGRLGNRKVGRVEVPIVKKEKDESVLRRRRGGRSP